MKSRFLHITFSMLFAALFLFAGTGYNLIQYCCSSCKDAGMEMLAEMSCESIHHHSCHAETPSQSAMHNSDKTCMHALDKGCEIERLTVDVPLLQLPTTDITDYALMVVEVADFQQVLLSLVDSSLESKHSHAPPNIPELLEGRDILTQKSVLVI